MHFSEFLGHPKGCFTRKVASPSTLKVMFQVWSAKDLVADIMNDLEERLQVESDPEEDDLFGRCLRARGKVRDSGEVCVEERERREKLKDSTSEPL